MWKIFCYLLSASWAGQLIFLCATDYMPSKITVAFLYLYVALSVFAFSRKP